MIYGIGVDIVRTERVRSAVERWGDRFLRRVFTEGEIAYAYSKQQPYLSLSVRFAAKEALIKAIGGEAAARLTDIEVTSRESGRPSISVRGGLADFFSARNICSAHVSLSHERDYGVACVVLEAGV